MIQDIRITKEDGGILEMAGVSQVLLRLNPADTAGRLEESKVIMGIWLSHLEHLTAFYPPVSLLALLSGWLQ